MDLCYNTNSKNSTQISLELFGLTPDNFDWYLDSKVKNTESLVMMWKITSGQKCRMAFL